MKFPQKRLTLFICLLSFLLTAKANNSSSQNSFEFLNIPLENATFVENGPALIKNTGVLALSTMINTGIWWAICKTPGFISAMTKKHQITDLEKQEVKSIKSDFCGQLAPLITTAETALAGQVSPWPIDPLWWQLVFLTGAGMAAYSSRSYISELSRPPNMATAVLTYLTAEGVSRTVSSCISSTILKIIEANHIDDTFYHANQYFVQTMYTGVMTGSIIYEMLLYKGAELAGSLISRISGIAASALLTTIFLHNAKHPIGFNYRISFIFGFNTVVAATAGIIAGVAVRAAAEVGATAGASAGVAAGFITSAGASAGAGAGIEASVKADTEVFTWFMVGALAGGGIGALSIMRLNKLAPDNYPLKLAGATAIATSLAILNSLSGFAAYGYPLEQSLSETTQTLWNKFLAPLDYIATLFPQFLSKSP